MKLLRHMIYNMWCVGINWYTCTYTREKSHPIVFVYTNWGISFRFMSSSTMVF